MSNRIEKSEISGKNLLIHNMAQIWTKSGFFNKFVFQNYVLHSSQEVTTLFEKLKAVRSDNMGQTTVKYNVRNIICQIQEI